MKEEEKVEDQFKYTIKTYNKNQDLDKKYLAISKDQIIPKSLEGEKQPKSFEGDNYPVKSLKKDTPAKSFEDQHKQDQKIKKEPATRRRTKLEQVLKKDPKILSEADKQAQTLIDDMKVVYNQDIRALYRSKMAYRKIKLMQTFSRKLQNFLIRRKFLELGGLDILWGWMLPIKNPDNEWIEPSMALKMSILRAVEGLRLSTEEIKQFATKLHGILYKTMQCTSIPELKQMCSQVMKSWDYTVYKQTIPRSRN